MAFEQQGDPEAALGCYEEAIALEPDFARAYFCRGNVFLDQGNAPQAIISYQRALSLKPDSAATHSNLANAYLLLDDLEAAAWALHEAISLRSDILDAHVTLGLVEARRGNEDAAVRAFARGAELASNAAHTHRQIAHCWQDAGFALRAIESYRTALEFDPGLLDIHYEVARLLHGHGLPEKAIFHYQQFLKAPYPHFDTHLRLASALRDRERYDEALRHFDFAIELAPEEHEGFLQKGVTLTLLRRTREARDCFQRALELKPDSADAQLCMGITYKDMGDISGALVYLHRALELRPDYVLAHSNLLFAQNYLGEQLGGQLLADAKRFGEVASREVSPYTEWRGAADPDRPLRIGLVSGDLGEHPVGFFLDAALAELTRHAGNRLAVYAYSHRYGDDTTGQNLRRSCHGWLTTMGMSDEALARQIREDGIDILIDLAGHTANNRLTVFAWKPAPVQVSWLGYFATTGLPAMDYFLADPWTLSPDQEAFFSEEVWRLPETRLCFTPPRTSIEVGPLPALTNGYVTFGCFNNLSKMNDAVVQVWSRVLKAVPDSKLFLKYGQLEDESVRQRTLDRFAAHGLPAERLILEAHSSRADYHSAHNRIDIALDPFPFPGGTTTVEALWMGVPVLTLQGETFLARQGVGLLMNAGLPDWVAVDEDDYVDRAIKQCRDLNALAALRAQLRAQVLASPVYDAPRFARHYEDALRAMWIRWCQRAEADVPPRQT